ncbi:MAG: twin-arginine translocase TatA/TatE family subunit [Miltoncostaeaceae bacterium]
MFDISPLQIIIVLAIALLVFGPKKLPELGRNLGKGIRDFKGGLTGQEAPAPASSATATTAEAPVDPDSPFAGAPESLDSIVAQGDAYDPVPEEETRTAAHRSA